MEELKTEATQARDSNDLPALQLIGQKLEWLQVRQAQLLQEQQEFTKNLRPR